MKSNEMPEKIYLFDYNDSMVTPIEGDTVYVREDAFIKKAERYIRSVADGLDRDDDVEAFINEFIKYMKGE